MTEPVVIILVVLLLLVLLGGGGYYARRPGWEFGAPDLLYVVLVLIGLIVLLKLLGVF